MPPGYAFIHPLLASDDNFAGYLVEFTDNPTDNAAAEALVNEPNFSTFDKRHPWFIPAPTQETPPPAPLIPCFRQGAAFSEAQQAQLKTLQQGKRKTGLFVMPGLKLPLPGAWDHAFVAPSIGRTLPPFALHGLASRTTVIADGVQNYSDRNWAQNNAYSLSTSEYLLTHGMPGRKADATRQKMLELLALIAQDAETEALNEVFRQEPKLSYSLLRLVNSAAIAPRTPITSFTQAINLLGRRPLERWLQLLIYADPDDGQHPNPLLYKAAVRGRLMELLAPSLQPPPDLPNLPDNAFMIGCFSLLNVLLDMPMAEILLQLPLSPTAIDALGQHKGSAGRLLQALQMADARNLSNASRQLAELGIPAATFLTAQVHALHWASRIR